MGIGVEVAGSQRKKRRWDKLKEQHMSEVSVRDLLEAGSHFGHQVSRWNPKMRPYIFAAKSGIHILDLQQTVNQLKTACDFVTKVTALGGSVLFVATKRQAQAIVQEEAKR